MSRALRRSWFRRQFDLKQTPAARRRRSRLLRLEALEGRQLLDGSGIIPGSIQGLKFHDVNGDGSYQPGEPGLSQWRIQLRDAVTDNLIHETWTAPDGRYVFSGLPPGSYLVREVRQPGWTQTTAQPSPISINNNSVTTLNEPLLAIGNFPSTTDYGDAPNSFGLSGYPTLLAQNGARHTVSSLFLGSGVDPDVNGQPTAAADGDDLDPDGNDETGVEFLTPLIPGTTARIEVTVSQPGRLDAFADFNRDGDWVDTFERIFNSQPLVAGVNTLSFSVPFPFSDFGHTYLRFRVSTAGGLGPTGPAADGEVEDYRQEIMAADFGDAPDVASNPNDFPTLRGSNGAAHAIPGLHLGGGNVFPGLAPTLWLGDISDPPDRDENGQPNNQNLGGDDGDLISGDDEDGVVFLGAFSASNALIPGLTNTVQVTFTHLGLGSGWLNAWLDFNRDGDWSDPGEQIFTDESLTDFSGTGTTYLGSFAVPADAVPGPTHARFRVSSQQGLSFTGLAWDGEVEDYADVQIETPLDWGDAPDNSLVPDDYPTTAAKDGARHRIVPGVHLGDKVDPELDGQPNAAADGDDRDLVDPSRGDDEDGVRLLTPLVPGTTAQVQVKASVAGFLTGFVDFTGDQNWDDPGEKVFTSIPVGMGFNTLSFQVPAGAALGTTYARFRFTTENIVLSDRGLAPDGEVEDYCYTILPADYGDAPDPLYPTLIARQGAGHAAQGGLILGNLRDTEPDGLPDNNALGDDGVVALNDDEDGVSFSFTRSPGKLLPGTSDSLVVTVSGAPAGGAYLDAWIDFNQDGDWSDPGEQVAISDPVIAGPNVVNGSNTLSFNVPNSAKPGTTFARFRLSSQGALAPTGMAFDGEVEDYKVLVETPYDFGDAPEGPIDPLDYPTTLARNGARHVIVPGVQLGERNDPELDGQPSPQADADDLNTAASGDDEDGVVFLTPLIPGATAIVQVTASVAGYLNAWVDFDVNLRWDTTGEQVFLNRLLAPGLNTLTFTVPASLTPPAGSLPVDTVARFRFTSQLPATPLSFTGEAPDGEVEDHRVTIYKGDWGDAPDPSYPTLAASNGPVHAVIPQTTPVALPSTLFLGSLVDGELNGQPHAAALGDDQALQDDEDGVTFVTQLMPGTQGTIQVTVGGAASVVSRFLDGWIDFNGDGDFLDPSEKIVASNGVTSNVALGVNTFTFSVPATARVGSTFARFRVSSAGQLSPVGVAADGEVEDYRVDVVPPLDFGDAPDMWNSNPTLFATATTSHAITPAGPILGSRRDADLTGQPSPTATGDDADFEGDDEDGVRLLTPLVQGAQAQVEVTASAAGLLNVWFDFNSDGDFADPGEQVADDLAVTAGANVLTIQVPFTPLDPSALPLNIISRFRIATAAGLDATGPAADGEVEDHLFTIYHADYGDAPENLPEGNYPTLRSSNGAGHAINIAGTPQILLGAHIDEESDGQPDHAALGDDLDTFSPPDDEDGVVFTSAVVPGSPATVQVTVTDNTLPAPPFPVTHLLQAWVDFNGDGDWNDAGEQVFTNQAVTAGVNTLTFAVPANAVVTTGVGGRGTPTFSRWRLSSQSNLGTTGIAFNGEVEDHAVEIHTPLDFGDAPDAPLFAGRTYGTYLANDGPRHPIRPGFSLGTRNDPEADGQPDIAAFGDDNSPAGADDEDGVIFPALLVPGNSGTAQVTATIPTGLPARLDAWIDFNGDGDFLDAAERIAANLPLNPGANTVTFTVPSNAPAIATIARFRLSSTGGLGPTGLALDGEVEDHLVLIGANVDFGDAPASYGTLLANNGARHLLVNNVHLGAPISGNDADLDGQPTADATGDDNDGTDDEDGVVFVTSLSTGHQATVRVTVQNVGYLSGWVDFNRDGDLADAGEKVLADVLMNPSLNPTSLNFTVPAAAAAGPSFARFRFSTVTGLSFDGPAPDGEVEDYRVTILNDPNLPTMTINDVTVVEGNSGTTNAVFVVTLSPTAGPVSVQYSTADGSATLADNDYQSSSGTLNFPASANGQTRTITVPVNGDTNPETDELFFVNLTNAIGANVTDAQGQGTIRNDDQAVVAFTQVLRDSNNQPVVADNQGRYPILPGSVYTVEVFVDDQRNAGAAGGVFAAYADLSYNPDVLDYQAGSLTIAAGFPNSRSGTIDEANRQVDEAGGATGFTPPGSDPAQLLFSVRFQVHANAALGTAVTLALNDADLPTHNTLVWGGPLGDVSASYQTHQLVVRSSTVSWQNPDDRFDVNDDGVLTNEDLQRLLAELRNPNGGPRQLVAPPEPPPPPFWDVNGDGLFNVLDAGAVRDELNRRASQPLRASSSADVGAGESLGADLSREQAAVLLEGAVARLVAVGLPADIAVDLRGVELEIRDLAGDLLAVASGSKITLDRDAAGWGWWLDETPQDDLEFALLDGELRRGGPGMDLLTVLAHELGHVAGLSHDSEPDAGVMSASLAAGIRRVDYADLVDELLADPE